SPTRAPLRSFPTIPPEPANTGSTSTSTPNDTSSSAASPSSSSSAASPPASRKLQGTTSPSSRSQQQSYGSDKCPHFLESFASGLLSISAASTPSTFAILSTTSMPAA